MLTLPQPRSLMGTSTGMKTSSEYIEAGLQEHIMLPGTLVELIPFSFSVGWDMNGRIIPYMLVLRGIMSHMEMWMETVGYLCCIRCTFYMRYSVSPI